MPPSRRFELFIYRANGTFRGWYSYDEASVLGHGPDRRRSSLTTWLRRAAARLRGIRSPEAIVRSVNRAYRVRLSPSGLACCTLHAGERLLAVCSLHPNGIRGEPPLAFELEARTRFGWSRDAALLHIEEANGTPLALMVVAPGISEHEEWVQVFKCAILLMAHACRGSLDVPAFPPNGTP